MSYTEEDIKRAISYEKAIETRVFYTWIEDGVLHTLVKKNANIGYEDAKELYDVQKILMNGQICPSLLDMRGIGSASREARNFASKEDASEDIRAKGIVAIIVSDFVSKTIGNFLMGLNKLPGKTKIFTDEEKALKWIFQTKRELDEP